VLNYFASAFTWLWLNFKQSLWIPRFPS